MKFILASSSTRRKELLKYIIDEFEICPSDEEEIDESNEPGEHVKRLAEAKAANVAGKYKDAVVIGADTLVFGEKGVLGKPETEEEAERMLKSLSGKSHKVLTGVCVINTSAGKMISDYSETTVFVDDLSEEWIKNYIKSGEPMDKAGAYGIQGAIAKYISRIEGCFYNVIGLPLNTLSKLLEKIK